MALTPAVSPRSMNPAEGRAVRRGSLCGPPLLSDLRDGFFGRSRNPGWRMIPGSQEFDDVKALMCGLHSYRSRRRGGVLDGIGTASRGAAAGDYRLQRRRADPVLRAENALG